MKQINPKYKLKTFSDQEVREAMELQRLNSSWDLYREREFLETLLHQRVNFVYTVFAVFVAAAATVKSQNHLILVFLTASIMLGALMYSVKRAYIRLDVVVKMLFKAENYHLMPFVQAEINATKKEGRFSELRTMYYRTPLLCFIIMLIGLIAAVFGWIELAQ